MILVANTIINESMLAEAYQSNQFAGCVLVFSDGTTHWESKVIYCTPKEIYQAIEEKNSMLRGLLTEIERLQKELKDTEDLYIKANTENESLRERLNEPKLPVSKWRTKDCPGYMGTADGCAGLRIAPEDGNEDTRIHTMCTACELFAFFCEQANADDNGCTGRRQKTGELFPRCIDCIGLIAEE